MTRDGKKITASTAVMNLKPKFVWTVTGKTITTMIRLLNGEQWDKNALLAKMLDDDFYYGHLGKHALSSSAIKLLQKSPKSYNNIVRKGKEQNSSALQIGTFIHTMVLEPHLFDERFQIIDVQSRVAKSFKEGKAKSNKIVLTAKEHDDNMRIVDAAMRNTHIMDIIRGAEFEIPEIGMIEGYPFRAKADIFDKRFGFIADLKTTREIENFKWSAEKFGYDIQAFIYTTLFETSPEQFKFLAIDKASLDIGIFDVKPSFINKGYAKLKEGIENYKTFFEQHNDLDDYTLRGTLEWENSLCVSPKQGYAPPTHLSPNGEP